jgi:4-hydroxy-2-oxoheptanedioate aldolase
MARAVRANRTKAKAQAGHMALGALLTYHSPETVEMLGAMGFDFITFDLEHEAYNELALVHSIRAAEAFDLTSIVRVPNDPDLILRLLDAGAQGVHVPRVNTREDAQAVVEASRFYPQGKRTFYAVGRSGNYGLGMTEEEYAEASNRETIVVLQVEEEEGVRNIQDIISVPCVDAIQVGPKDLWQSMGMPDRAVVWQVVDRVLAQASEAGRWGSMVAWMDSDIGDQLSRYKGLGVRLVTVSPRELLVHGGRHFLEQAARAGG